jgi:hypothetical protein
LYNKKTPNALSGHPSAEVGFSSNQFANCKSEIIKREVVSHTKKINLVIFETVQLLCSASLVHSGNFSLKKTASGGWLDKFIYGKKTKKDVDCSC